MRLEADEKGLRGRESFASFKKRRRALGAHGKLGLPDDEDVLPLGEQRLQRVHGLPELVRDLLGDERLELEQLARAEHRGGDVHAVVEAVDDGRELFLHVAHEERRARRVEPRGGVFGG